MGQQHDKYWHLVLSYIEVAQDAWMWCSWKSFPALIILWFSVAYWEANAVKSSSVVSLEHSLWQEDNGKTASK